MCCVPTSCPYTTALPTPGDLLFIQDTCHPTWDAKGKEMHGAYLANPETRCSAANSKSTVHTVLSQASYLSWASTKV